MTYRTLSTALLSVFVVACTPVAPQNNNRSSSSSAVSSGRYILRYHIDNAVGMGIDKSLQSGKTSEYEMDAEVMKLFPQGNPGQVVLPSIKDAMPSLKDPSNKTLIVFAQPKDGTTVFTEALWQTDADVHSLYTFDEFASELSAMNSSAIFNARAYGSAYKSPNEKYVAVMQNEADGKDLTKISIIDLSRDVVIDTFTAPANRSVRRSSDMPFVADVTWVNNGLLLLGLYDTAVPYCEDIKPVDYAEVVLD